ncbi:MAG: hypothetical protein ACK58L_09275 [Planctomycetota bacterium]
MQSGTAASSSEAKDTSANLPKTGLPGEGSESAELSGTVAVQPKASAATRDDAERIAEAISVAIAHEDESAFSSLIDHELFADRILHGLAVSEEFRSSYRKQIADDGGLANVGTDIIDSVKNGGDYSLVRIVDRNGDHRPVFRMLLADGSGLSHHEIILNEDRNGKSKIVDIFVYLTGEDVSDSLRAIDLSNIASQSEAVRQSLGTTEAAIVESAGTLQKIQSLATESQADEALELYDDLPANLKTNRGLLMRKLGVAQRVSEEKYFQVLDECQKHHPMEPAFLFRTLDMLAVQERHLDVLNTVERLLQLTGDEYLNLMKVKPLLALNRPEDARSAVAAAKKVSDNRIDAYWVETSVLLKAKDYTAVAKQLDEIATKFGMTFNDLSAIPDYAEFIASDQGKAWLEVQKNTPSESVPKVPNSPSIAAPAQSR